MVNNQHLLEQDTKYRKELIEKLMRIHELYGNEYRTIVDEYNDLQEQKREKHLKLYPLKARDLKDFPDFPFLATENENLAEEMLNAMTISKLVLLCTQIERIYVESALRKNLKSRIEDSKMQLSRARVAKKYGMDPDLVHKMAHSGIRYPRNEP